PCGKNARKAAKAREVFSPRPQLLDDSSPNPEAAPTLPSSRATETGRPRDSGRWRREPVKMRAGSRRLLGGVRRGMRSVRPAALVACDYLALGGTSPPAVTSTGIAVPSTAPLSLS